jgi:Leucine-rich repeat (LRR) protein
MDLQILTSVTYLHARPAAVLVSKISQLSYATVLHLLVCPRVYLHGLSMLPLQSSGVITELTADSLRGLDNVEQLIITDNSIATIEDGAFENMLKLRVLDLSVNMLQHITSRTFSGAVNIEILDLSYNLLSAIPDLGCLINLQELTLGPYRITNTQFPVGFRNLTRLSVITLFPGTRRDVVQEGLD